MMKMFSLRILLLLYASVNAAAANMHLSWKPLRVHHERQISVQICPQAAPGVDGSKIFMAACVQNPQNDISNCLDRLWNYTSSSTVATCQHFYNQYQSCLAVPNYDSDDCKNEHELWNSCADYTLQAYAYCGCFYNLPNDISNCANVELGIQEQAEIQSDHSSYSGDLPSAATGVTEPNQSDLGSGTSTGGAGLGSGQVSGQPTTAAIGPTFTPSFTPTGTLASTPDISANQVSTVATFTTMLPSVTLVTSTCTKSTSTYLCTTTSTLTEGDTSPWVTGFVCQGGVCQNQQAGYEYCVRIIRAITA